MSIATSYDGGYLGDMSEEDIARFRAQAEECQAQADRSIRTTDKEAWLRMANEWLKLAQDVERRRR